ncbi:MAG: PQQ-like beta-propeller repeat protein [Bryobacterales bacterium]|nr:PQQ-like beta-propeller repeat protein [Bryobacterales bacterium]
MRRRAALGLLAGAAARAADWPQWRGPAANGVAADGDPLPLEWGPERNVLWRSATPSWSAATPIVSGGTVFVTSAEEGFSATGGGGLARHAVRQLLNTFDGDDAILLLALDARTGKERWRQTLGGGNRIHLKHNEASPSPVTDGSRVWVMTGLGALGCCDFTGKLVWRRDLAADYGPFGLNWGYGSSPVLDRGRLYVQVLQGYKTDEPSYLLALDAATGRPLWKVERPTDAIVESPDAYTTPLLVETAGGRWLAVTGAGYVTLHALDDGREVARIGGLIPNRNEDYRNVASATLAGDVLLVPTRRSPFTAFRITAGPKLERLWTNDHGPDVPTPVSDGERVWLVDDKGIMQCLRVEDGEPLWSRRRIEPGLYSSSLVLAGGRVYATSEECTTTVLAAGDDFQTLAVNKLGEHILASPAIAGGKLFLRTAEAVYCVGGGPG